MITVIHTTGRLRSQSPMPSPCRLPWKRALHSASSDTESSTWGTTWIVFSLADVTSSVWPPPRPPRACLAASIPVIDMDTLIAPLDRIDVLTFLEPDNEFMGAAVTGALVEAIGGQGTIIMTQGALGHTGAQGRARGFESVIANFPGVQVLATDWADWDVAKTAQLWETYLNTYPRIYAAFFHND